MDIRSICCDAPVISARLCPTPPLDGRYITCRECLNLLAFVPSEDLETLQRGEIPRDDVLDLKELLERFMDYLDRQMHGRGCSGKKI